MPLITGYHHLSLSVSDLDRSTAWYREVLGFTLDGDVEGNGFRRARLVHPGSGLTLTLTRHDRAPGDAFDERRTGLDHVALAVPSSDDLSVFEQQLRSRGIEHSGIKQTGPGAALLTLRDPDNIQLELFWREP